MSSLSDIEKMSVKELNEYYASFGKETLKEEGLMSASDFRQLKKQEKIEHIENNYLFDPNIEENREEMKKEDALLEEEERKRLSMAAEWRSYENMTKNQLIDMIMTQKYGSDWFEQIFS